jgi:hypothetical protein
LAGLQKHDGESGRWLIGSIRSFDSMNDADSEQRNTQNFLVTYREADGPEKEKLRTEWEAAGLGPFLPDAEEQSNDPTDDS